MHSHGLSVLEIDAAKMPLVLPSPQREALCELGLHGFSREFDPIVMAALYCAGLVAVGKDQRVILTDRGLETFRRLTERGE
jgi:hypothetical protein